MLVQYSSNKDRKMSEDVCPVERQDAKHKAAITNGSRATIFGDGRSAGARRYRDLLSAFSADLGEPLSAAADQVVRRLSQASVELELMEAASASGTAIDPVAFCTLVNVQRRLLKDLDTCKRQRRAEPKRQLQEYLASKAKPAGNAPNAPSEAA
jgi:hypothetical protein